MRDRYNDAVNNRSAPWFPIPPTPVVGVEHPCLITNIAKAIDTLGGPSKLEKLVGDKSASVEADLHLHPGERNAKPIASFNSKTSNVLLKITFPKRTGRKRKKGSDDAWQPVPEVHSSKSVLLSDPQDARDLLQNMQDNPNRYVVEPVGMVEQTHRFRRKV
ncbi:MAG: hypothetical protein Q9182_006255 [Xanthomendoza sp. 2 TL-2023]